MPSAFTYEFDTPTYKGKTNFNTGLFINGQYVDGSDKTYIEYVLLLIAADQSLIFILHCSVVNPSKHSTILLLMMMLTIRHSNRSCYY